MLIDVQYNEMKEKLIVSHTDEKGGIKIRQYNWSNPTKFDSCLPDDPDAHPIYKSWDGKNIKLIPTNRPDRYAIYDFIDSLPKEERDIIHAYHEPKIYFIDIETEIIDGFPDAETAPTQVLSISIVYDNKCILLGLKDLTQQQIESIRKKTNKHLEKLGIEFEIKYIKYADEFDMMFTFFNKMIPTMPCISGWFVYDYDWKYLINRAKKITKTVNSKLYTIDIRVTSPTRRMYKEWTPPDKAESPELPMHRLIIDYKLLYEKNDTSVKVKESSSLDFVSEKILGIKKIKFDGSLKKLYDEDFETFMFYNAVDSILVQLIHNKMNYISIIYGISTLAELKASDILSHSRETWGSLVITEGVLRKKFKDIDNVILFKDTSKSNSKVPFVGGWVKEPSIGMNRWAVCYDFASLYPTTQRQFFISPENYLGDYKDGMIYSSDKPIPFDSTIHVRCVNDAVFLKRKSPTILMLEEVFGGRRQYKNKMMAAKFEYDDTMREIKRLEKELGM